VTHRLTQQALESYLWGAAVILRGLVDAGDYKQFIFPLLFYKRLSDVWDEEYAAAGAELVKSAADVWARAQMIMKVERSVRYRKPSSSR